VSRAPFRCSWRKAREEGYLEGKIAETSNSSIEVTGSNKSIVMPDPKFPLDPEFPLYFSLSCGLAIHDVLYFFT
jgi:hypothetical protein